MGRRAGRSLRPILSLPPIIGSLTVQHEGVVNGTNGELG